MDTRLDITLIQAVLLALENGKGDITAINSVIGRDFDFTAPGLQASIAHSLRR